MEAIYGMINMYMTQLICKYSKGSQVVILVHYFCIDYSFNANLLCATLE